MLIVILKSMIIVRILGGVKRWDEDGWINIGKQYLILGVDYLYAQENCRKTALYLKAYFYLTAICSLLKKYTFK